MKRFWHIMFAFLYGDSLIARVVGGDDDGVAVAGGIDEVAGDGVAVAVPVLAPPPAAPVLAPPPELLVVPPPEAGRMNVRWRRSAMQKVGLLKKGLKRSRTAIARVNELVNPSLQRAVAQKFGFNTKIMGRNDKTLCQLTIDPSVTMLIDKRRQLIRHRQRGLTPHVSQTRAKLADLIGDAELVVFTEVSDDATLWTRLPPDNTEKSPMVEKSMRRQRARSVAAAADKSSGRCRRKPRAAAALWPRNA